MAPPAGGARAQLVYGFDILEDEALAAAAPCPSSSPRRRSPTAREPLEELSAHQRQNQALATAFQELKSLQSRTAWRAPAPATRIRRPPIEPETFEPLDAVAEESSLLEASLLSQKPVDVGELLHPRELSSATPVTMSANAHDAVDAPYPPPGLDSDPDIQEQVAKHLAGQYEWLLTYPHPDGQAGHGGPPPRDHGNPRRSIVYGCNMLRRKQDPPSGSGEQHGLTNTYSLLATPLKPGSFTLSDAGGPYDAVAMGISQPQPYAGGPLRVPDVVAVVEQALSPSLSSMSERSGSFAEVSASSRADSFSLPRIEDSLEELDKLEEELEAVNEATLPRPVPVPHDDDGTPAKAAPKTPSDERKTPLALKCASATKPATVRVKAAQAARPAVRRSMSLTPRDMKPERPGTTAEHESSGARAATVARCSTTSASKAAAKSTKPPTVAKFELPGDAVARRLKEQRETREAKQAEAQKVQAATATTTPRSRANKALAKPTFELPGEAISRRKREEREAKLKAEEEEERKRREFKARPVRRSMGPATLPRATLASLARQSRSSSQDGTEEERRVETVRAKRLSMGVARPATASSCASTVTSKRNTLSAEELEQQRLRGKEVLERDSVLAKDRERDKRERESKAKLAREEAAERSRMASREWAEKKRRREMQAKAKA